MCEFLALLGLLALLALAFVALPAALDLLLAAVPLVDLPRIPGAAPLVDGPLFPPLLVALEVVVLRLVPLPKPMVPAMVGRPPLLRRGPAPLRPNTALAATLAPAPITPPVLRLGFLVVGDFLVDS